MAVEIRETIVTPSGDHDITRLHISDAPPGDESATIVVQILVRHPSLLAPALAHLQRGAMKAAQDALTPLLQSLKFSTTKATSTSDEFARHVRHMVDTN